MKLIKIFYDTETTGVKVNRHGIHQISGCIEVDGEVVENFDFKVQPNPKAEILEEALAVSGVTKEEVLAYPPMLEVYKQFVKMLGEYISKYDKKNKAFLVGFNNRAFDDKFLRAWFEQNGDQFFNSWFWQDSLDVLVLACQYLLDRRLDMPSFKLKRVCLELGIEVDKSKLHDAAYDISLTRQAYRICTGLEEEI